MRITLRQMLFLVTAFAITLTVFRRLIIRLTEREFYDGSGYALLLFYPILWLFGLEGIIPSTQPESGTDHLYLILGLCAGVAFYVSLILAWVLYGCDHLVKFWKSLGE